MHYLWTICTLLLIVPVFAQDGDGDWLSINDERAVLVTADESAKLVLANDEAGQIVTITARAVDTEQIDPAIWIIDDEAQLLAYNDNSFTAEGAFDPTARISNLELTKSGFYTIYVDSFNGVSEGEVEIVIRQGDPFNTRVNENNARLVIQATLPEDTVFIYSLQVDQDAVFTLTAKDISGTLDPYLRIVDSSGNVIETSDDHTTLDLSLNLFDARIENWLAPADATYTIEVLDFLGWTGDIELKIEQH
jgi:hypothetical protein